jgi:hypothetical protein
VFDTDIGGRAIVDIFDVNGVPVKTVSFDATGFTSRVQIRDVDIGDLASGLYVCKLRIESGGGEASGFFKLAVKR